MGYRLTDKEFNPEDYLPRFYVRNGAQIQIVLNCYYYTPEGMPPAFYYRDPHHEPVAWNDFYPEPWKPQPKFPDMAHLPEDFTEIDLVAEGYTGGVTVSWDDEDELYDTSRQTYNIGTITRIIDDDPNVVSCKVSTNFATLEEEKELKFTIFVKNENTYNDAVCRGILVVLPGPPCDD